MVGNDGVAEKIGDEIVNGNTVRTLEIQIRASRYKKALPALRSMELRVESSEHASSRVKGDNEFKGELVLDQTQFSGLAGLLKGLGKHGYQLVKAFIEKREYREGKGCYYIQRFVFCHPDFYDETRLSPALLKARVNILSQLMARIYKTRGRCRAFDNSYVDPVKGTRVEGERALVVNYDYIESLFDSEHPRMTWKLPGGKKVEGNEKIRVAPIVNIGFNGQTITAVSA